MDSEISALRTELKSWERSFRATHGRDPSIQDIKEQPNLAEKYKRHKKLSKAESSHSTKSKPLNPPSTPPRSQSRHSTHLLSKPRVITTAQPLTGYNPFSPQKNKGKQRELTPDDHPSTNPFRGTRSPSPEPARKSSTFPSAIASDPFAPTPNTAVSRARKRLRGEPVSPSPNKEKRRRIVSPHEESDDEDDELGAANTSFVDDSPVKPPNGVRSFKLLFDEASAAKPKFPLLRAKTLGPVGEKTLLAAENENMDIDGPSKPVENVPSPVGQHATVLDPFFEPVERGKPSSSDDEITDDRPPPKLPIPVRSLLAPSPPPETRRSSGNHHLHNGKGRGKPEGPKKVKVSDEDDDDRSEEDAEMNGNGFRHRVRLFNRTASRGRVPEDNVDEDAYHLMGRRSPDTETYQHQDPESISVPDTLLSILSLAPTSSHGRQDEHVVEQLLYGGRRGNYDPSKGGEIWGVGEFEDEERDEFALHGPSGDTKGTYDDEDDWEGEGVPWEVGEL
ncbi:hypothetical protein C8R44DRAFT_883981 [Mycena epipterygia]|nr:hypothetical protein C8R44DRAFT_883981 [Mycena epipterygia]